MPKMALGVRFEAGHSTVRYRQLEELTSKCAVLAPHLK